MRVLPESLANFDVLRRKSRDRKSETLALAKMHEENARECNAGGDSKGFKQHLEVSIDHFLHADNVKGAVSCLIKTSQFLRAASKCSRPSFITKQFY